MSNAEQELYAGLPMTAFLLDTGSDPKANSALPEGPGSVHSERFTRDFQVTYRKLGDVAVAHADGSALLMLGYVSDAPFVSLGTDERQNAAGLLAHLDTLDTLPKVADFIGKLAGSFGFVYARRNGTVLCITDRWASRPLWRYRDGDRTLISSHVLSIAALANCRELNQSAVASVLLYGAPVLPQNSLFVGVEGQRPGTVIERTAHAESETTWYRFEHVPNHGRSSRDWARLAASRLRTSAERILKVSSRPSLFLSGGLDSRLAAAALVAAGGRPHMISLTDQENLESRVARLVAKVLGCSHTVVFRDNEHYLRAMRATAQSSSGNMSWIHSHFSEAYLKVAEEHDLGAVLIGDLSEAFTKLVTTAPLDRTELWTAPEFADGFDDLLLTSYRPIDRARTLELLSKNIRHDAEAHLRAQLMKRYADIEATSPEAPIVADQFIRWESLAAGATYQMFFDVRVAGRERNVMLDPGVHDLLTELPAVERAGKRLGARTLRELHLPAALAPDANSLVPVMGHAKLHQFSKAMRPKLGQLKRRFLSNDYTTTASWPHLPLLMQREESWKNEIRALLLDEELLSADVWDRAAVEACLKQFFDGDTGLHRDIEHMTSLASFFRAVRR